jgi:4-hydroxybenzoyl-CoA thioesterase
MIVFERPVKFEEVDAANIVFFARFVTYAHEAMEHFFGGHVSSHPPDPHTPGPAGLEGGYAGLILERRVGLPAVHVEIAFTAPARYGDVLRIETRVARVGNRSAVLWYQMHHVGSGRLACEMKHTVVTTDLRTLASCDMPGDVRALLLKHLEPPETEPALRPDPRSRKSGA